VQLPTPILTGRLIRRRLRFLLDLRLDGGELCTVHCPNTGTMEGCLEPDALVLSSRAANPERKYPYGAELIQLASGVWIGINTHRANLIVGEALRRRAVPELAVYDQVRAEVRYGRSSRADFLLEAEGEPPCLVEVKNATWPTPDGGIGFPDAVTLRGQKHVRELRAARRRGTRAVFLFLCNRDDGSFFRPCHERDPDYAEALARAAGAGVEVLAYRVRFAPPTLELGERLPVELPSPRARSSSRRGPSSRRTRF
jgi:sugar fermentation stimulation protein A